MFDDLRRQAEREQKIAELKDATEMVVEVMPQVARVQREYYDALLEQGFSEDEALLLVSKHFNPFNV